LNTQNSALLSCACNLTGRNKTSGFVEALLRSGDKAKLGNSSKARVTRSKT